MVWQNLSAINEMKASLGQLNERVSTDVVAALRKANAEQDTSIGVLKTEDQTIEKRLDTIEVEIRTLLIYLHPPDKK